MKYVGVGYTVLYSSMIFINIANKEIVNDYIIKILIGILIIKVRDYLLIDHKECILFSSRVIRDFVKWLLSLLLDLICQERKSLQFIKYFKTISVDIACIYAELVIVIFVS